MVALPPGRAGLNPGLASARGAEPDSRGNVGPSAGVPHCPPRPRLPDHRHSFPWSPLAALRFKGVNHDATANGRHDLY